MPLTLGLGFLNGSHLPPPTYWPMEPSDPATSLRSRGGTPCAIHGWGTCPYPVASRWLDLSSPSQREGGEGITTADEDPIEIYSVLDSPSRLALRHITLIQVGAQGRPTGTLAPRSGARKLEGGGGVTCDRIHGVVTATTTTAERCFDLRYPTITTTRRSHHNHHTVATLEPHRGLDPSPIHPPRHP
jgi:hypothetical protein